MAPLLQRGSVEFDSLPRYHLINCEIMKRSIFAVMAGALAGALVEYRGASWGFGMLTTILVVLAIKFCPPK